MEARAIARYIRVSPRKARLLIDAIRGKDVDEALRIVQLSTKKAARPIRKTLESAIANAENNHQLDVDRLYVAEATVGKSMVMKRIRPRARGRVGRILKPWSRLTLVVREREETA